MDTSQPISAPYFRHSSQTHPVNAVSLSRDSSLTRLHNLRAPEIAAHDVGHHLVGEDRLAFLPGLDAHILHRRDLFCVDPRAARTKFECAVLLESRTD